MRLRSSRSLRAPPRLLRLDHVALAARGLDRLARLRAERVGRHDEVLALEVTAREHLYGSVLAGRKPTAAESLGRDLAAVLEPVQIRQVDGLVVGAEGLKGQRLLHVRSAQLAHAHVQRDLPALVAGLALVAGS